MAGKWLAALPKPRKNISQPSELGGRFNHPQLSVNFFEFGPVMAEKLYFEVIKINIFLQKI